MERKYVILDLRTEYYLASVKRQVKNVKDAIQFDSIPDAQKWVTENFNETKDLSIILI